MNAVRLQCQGVILMIYSHTSARQYTLMRYSCHNRLPAIFTHIWLWIQMFSRIYLLLPLMNKHSTSAEMIWIELNTRPNTNSQESFTAFPSAKKPITEHKWYVSSLSWPSWRENMEELRWKVKSWGSLQRNSNQLDSGLAPQLPPRWSHYWRPEVSQDPGIASTYCF